MSPSNVKPIRLLRFASLALVLVLGAGGLFASGTGSSFSNPPQTDDTPGLMQQRTTRYLYDLDSSGGPISPFANLGANVTLNVKASAGVVFSVYCHNLNAADRYIQIHDTAATPSGGAAPKLTFYVPAGAAIVIGSDFFTNSGISFSSGIAFAFSTTEATYTAGTAADQVTQISFK